MSLTSASSVEEAGGQSSVHTDKSPSSLALVQFGFQAKTSYDADEALLQTRSQNFRLPPARQNDDIWKRPPPDFRYVVFDPKPPKRNTAESMRPWDYGTIPGQREIIKRPRDDDRLPRLFQQKTREPDIITRFHIDRPFTAKRKFVTEGMYSPGQFQDPKLHDFRQYPPLSKLGLDEFVTDYEKDPYNIKFKSERLNQIHGLPWKPTSRDLVSGRQMAPPMSGKKKWEGQLILDKVTWPQKNAAFSRHRRRHRQPYSAFLERVERDLNAQWSREQMEKTLENCT